MSLDAAPPVREEEMLLSIEDENAFSPEPLSIFTVLRMFLALLLVAAVIYFFVFFLKRLARPQAEQNPHLKILASTHLGSGRYVHVISVGIRAYLIGSGEGGVNHIADLDDREAVDAMLVDSSRKSAEALTPLSSFRSLLNKLSGGGSVPPEQDRLDTMRRRRERFKRF